MPTVEIADHDAIRLDDERAGRRVECCRRFPCAHHLSYRRLLGRLYRHADRLGVLAQCLG